MNRTVTTSPPSGAFATAMSAIRAFGARLSAATERWIPDSWVICMTLTAITFVVAMASPGVSLDQALTAWGGGMWTLLELAMQFTIAMVAAHACVSSPPVFRLMDRLAAWPNPQKPSQAILVTGLFSLATGYLNWAFCLMASALFVPFVCRRNPRADVRIVVAASYLGLGTVWHGGLSGSAPLILATPNNPLIAPTSGAPVVDRLIPVTETLFTPFNLIYLVVIGAVALGTLIVLHPREHVVTLPAEQLKSILPGIRPSDAARTPADRIDRFRGWMLLAAVLIGYPLIRSFAVNGFGATWTINAYNMVFLLVALLVHGSPRSFVEAFRSGMGTASGIVLQFPFYAGIFGVLNNTGLGVWIGSHFVRVATAELFPLLVFLYSGLMNLFVPSAGSKWLIEAPYLLPAARELGVSVHTVVLAYAYGDSNTNLIQPFWALPLLAVTRLRFGDILGYTLVVALACLVVNLVAMLLIPPVL